MPSLKVELGLDLGNNSPIGIKLNDPIQGKLDSSYVLGGEAFIDITDSVQSISTRRGKNQSLGQIDSGFASIELENQTRTFDPQNPNSPYFGALIPRREIRITANTYPLYFGYIDDYELDYQPNGLSTVGINCIDGFSNLANAVIPETVVGAELSSDRVETILDLPEVAWATDKRVIGTGTQTLGAETIQDDTAALSYLQTVSQSEFGNLFIDKSGDLNFQPSNFSPSNPSLSFTDNPSVDFTYKIKFSRVGVSYGTEFLYNRIVLSNGTDNVVVEDLISQGLYGVRTYQNNGLLNSTSASLTTLANSLLAQFKQPRYRFETIQVRLERLTETEQNAVLDLEVGDLANVTFTPNQIPPAIEQDCRIVGISHSWNLNSQVVTFSVEPFGTGSTVFVLDSATSGVLDSDLLG